MFQLKKAFQNTNNNLKMLVPNLLLGAVIFVGIFLLAMVFMSGPMYGRPGLGALYTSRSFVVIFLIVFIMVPFTLVTAFHAAGMFGMAREVVHDKAPVMADYFQYGKRYFLRSFVVMLVIIVPIIMVSLIWVLNGDVEEIEGLISNPLINFVISMFGAVFTVFVQYTLASIVVNDYGLKEGVKTGFRRLFEKSSPFIVVILGTITFSISLLALLPGVGGFIELFLNMYYAVLITNWFTLRVYTEAV